MWLHTEPKKVKGGWYYQMYDESNKDNTFCECTSVDKPDKAILAKKIDLLNNGKKMDCTMKKKGTVRRAKVLEQIMKVLTKNPITVKELCQVTNANSTILRKVLNKEVDRRNIKMEKIKTHFGMVKGFFI